MFKKFLTTVLALASVAVIGTFSASAASLGDVDNSGGIDIEDAVTILNHINGVSTLSTAAEKVADVDSSGNVDIEDVVAIINHINGMGTIGDSGSTSSGRKLDQLRADYKKGYTLKLQNVDYPSQIWVYVLQGNNFFSGLYFDGVLYLYEVRATDGVTYLVNVYDKKYSTFNTPSVPSDMDYVNGIADKYIKSVEDGVYVSEYYTAGKNFFQSGGQIIYTFNKYSSALMSIEFKPNDTSMDIAETYRVTTINNIIDKSKFAVPNLSGYTKR